MSGSRAPGSIALFHGGLGFGGTERVLVEQVRAFSAFEAPVDVWSVDPDAPTELVDAVRAANPHVRDVARLSSARDVRRTVKRRRYEVVVTSTAQRAYRGLLQARRFPFACRPAVVETLHERYGWSLADPEGRRRRLVDLWLLTHDVRDALRAALGVPPERTAIARPLFPGLLLDLTPHDLAEGRALRARLGIPDAAVVVGYLGRLSANKGLEEVIPMVARLVAAGADAHLVLGGRVWPTDPAFERLLEETCARVTADVPAFRDRLHRLGPVPEGRPAYAAFDVVALASRTEGLLPLMLVEAMSAGLPVVTTDVGGIGSCLRDGIDASVVKKRPDDEGPLTPEARATFQGRLAALVGDAALRARLGAAGRARIRALVAENDFAADTRHAIVRAMELVAAG